MQALVLVTIDPAVPKGGIPMSHSSEVFERRTCSSAHRLISLYAPALLLAACGAESGSSPTLTTTSDPETATESARPAPTTCSPSAAIATGDLDIIVAPCEDGSLPSDLWVGCQYGPVFEVSDLEEITPLAKEDPGGISAAIQPFLDSGEGQYWAQAGWMILRETEDEVLLVNESPAGLSFMTVQRVDGAWTWSGSQSGGPCPLYYVVPDGLNTVDWRLDPEAPPNPSRTTLDVLVRERECVSGQEVNDRLRDPQVVMTGDVVRIAFAAEPPPGDAFDCQGNPETAVTVELPESLGERQIIEGLAIGIDLEDYLPTL